MTRHDMVGWLAIVVGVLLLVVIAYDLTQRSHAILRNFPIIGHFRYLLEAVGPELRQYIVVDNDTEKPFSRDQRRWVYSAAKNTDKHFGFGADNDLESSSGYVIGKQAAFPMLEARRSPAVIREPARVESVRITNTAATWCGKSGLPTSAAAMPTVAATPVAFATSSPHIPRSA